MDYLALFSVACAKISPDYFKIPTADGEHVWRERVYCYELYHQLRMLLGDMYPMVIQGELDKAGHGDATGAILRAKPDFVFHVPGSHRENGLVVEVKAAPNTTLKAVLAQDYNKLNEFTYEGGKFHYPMWIFLIYGLGAVEIAYELNQHLAKYKNPNLRVIVHSEIGHAEAMPLPI